LKLRGPLRPGDLGRLPTLNTGSAMRYTFINVEIVDISEIVNISYLHTYSSYQIRLQKIRTLIGYKYILYISGQYHNRKSSRYLLMYKMMFSPTL